MIASPRRVQQRQSQLHQMEDDDGTLRTNYMILTSRDSLRFVMAFSPE